MYVINGFSHQKIYLHINLSLFVSIYHSIYLTYLSIYVFIYLSLYMSIYVSIHLFFSQMIYDFVDSVMITLRKMSYHIIHYQCRKPSGGYKEYKNKFFLFFTNFRARKEVWSRAHHLLSNGLIFKTSILLS